tara:strand:+ start:4874 stop:5470 length:597 start_codon:yes stop_codon:yes gene_type:complete
MNKHALSRIAQIVHLLALSVWLGAVGMSGVVAAIVFPLMRELEPTLGAYPNYEGDHALLAAGRVASKVFFAVDTIQFVCGTIALATIVLLVVCGYSLNTLARVLRVIVLCMTLGLLSYHLLLFMPELMRMLQGYWDNAAMGDTEVADRFKDEFLAQHSKASNILGALALMVMVNIVVAGVTLTARPRAADGRGDGSGA